jgi:hypothetical protein
MRLHLALVLAIVALAAQCIGAPAPEPPPARLTVSRVSAGMSMDRIAQLLGEPEGKGAIAASSQDDEEAWWDYPDGLTVWYENRHGRAVATEIVGRRLSRGDETVIALGDPVERLPVPDPPPRRQDRRMALVEEHAIADHCSHTPASEPSQVEPVQHRGRPAPRSEPGAGDRGPERYPTCATPPGWRGAASSDRAR